LESTQTLSTLDRAEELLANHNAERALDTIRTLYGQTLPSTDRGRALAIETVCLERLDRQSEASTLITEVMQEEGDDRAFVLAAGVAFSDLDAFVHADTFLRNLCALEPEDHVPWYNLAVALGRAGRYPEAIEAYDTCLRCEPTFTEAYVQRAFCHEMLNDLDAAASTYRTYLDTVPSDAEIWKALGIVESDRRRFDAAYRAFAQAAEHTSDPEDIYFNWAITAVRRQDMAQLEACIDRLQDLDAEGWRTLLARADHEEAVGNVWPAWELLCEAFEALLDDEDDEDEAREYVAAVLLRYAHRNEMREHAADQILKMFEFRLLGEDVLEALQTLEGRFSRQTASYQVVLRAVREGKERYIAYGVSDENPVTAGEAVRAFEARCSADEWDLYSIHQLSEPDEGRVGVYWRSSEYDRPPGT